MASSAGDCCIRELSKLGRKTSSCNLRQFRFKEAIVRSKGAVLTLIWSFTVSMLLSYAIDYRFFAEKLMFHHLQAAIIAGMALTSPIAGWLADTFFGRYKFIRVTLGILWASNAFTLLCSLVEDLSGLSSQYFSWIRIISFCVVVLTLGGFQANILQFGVDQLVDASSREIQSYITWYIWTIFLSNTIFFMAQKCFCKEYQRIVDILVVICLTIAVCSDVAFSKSLIVEPASLNPLKVIFRVLKYTVKNKYPRQRSAFTYWEDEPYSRIDLAKSKYGGPFTTEQVEDVKTLYRMLTVICCLTPFIVLMFITSIDSAQVIQHYHDDHYEENCSSTNHHTKNCFKRVLVEKSGNALVIVSLPIWELVIKRFFPRFLSLKIAKKLIGGMLLLLMYNLNLLLLEIVSYYYTPDVALGNHTATVSIPCLLFASTSNLVAGKTLQLSYKWLLLPNIFNEVALYLIVKASIEFICAQSPYSMKGWLIGIAYAMAGLAIVLASLLRFSIQQIFKKYGWEHLSHGCGVWYLLATALFNILIVAAACVMIKWYSRRRRDENIHNEQIFAENYYDYYTQFNKRPRLGH